MLEPSKDGKRLGVRFLSPRRAVGFTTAGSLRPRSDLCSNDVPSPWVRGRKGFYPVEEVFR